ncbi:glycosyltransferase family 39 protein [Pseudarthrobacter equi]|uniref:glycosyltransferase family 39 protein n=1 Tax=Pseudarthrobacter equi TaxID=728066 RepID=UPI000B89320C|nr:glycosyltransferase family 39 protein [Pseudarthrobacter equi]
MSTFTTFEADNQKIPLATAELVRARICLAGMRLWRGQLEDPRWERPALLLILAMNATLYCWNLSINGWANYFYSAGVQSGTMDPKALFFGSSDWGNSITVDKPPLSLWIMGLSVRLLGLNSVGILLPQALMGVVTTFLIYAILHRTVSSIARLLGAVIFFTTPIITLMSRYNNPDPLMLLLMVGALWFTVRAIETGRGRMLVATGALLGLAFMTKQLQGLLSLPALGISFLLFSGQRWPKRILTAACAGVVLVVSGGLWMTMVDLTPANHRPYVGGSVNNSVLDLTFGYNGIDRIATGGEITNAMQVPDQYRTSPSDAGLFRLLNANYNQESSWLLFAAMLAILLLGAAWKNLPNAPALRFLVVASCTWLLTAFLLLSFMGNQIHTYYTAALGPPLALVLGLTVEVVVCQRHRIGIRLSGTVIALAALVSTWLIISGTTLWPEWLSTAALLIGILALSALAVNAPSPKIHVGAAMLLAVALLSGPALTSMHNVTVGFTGSNPLSGGLSRNPAGISHLLQALRNNEMPWGHDIAFGRAPDIELVETVANAKGCTWAAATYASQTSARLQLASNRPVMPLGGFAGSDPSPSLDEFKRKVADGQICYYVEQQAFLEVQGPDSIAVAISDWVHSNFQSQLLGSTTVFRLVKDS